MATDTSQIEANSADYQRRRTLRMLVFGAVAILAVAVIIYLLVKRGQNQSATATATSGVSTNPSTDSGDLMASPATPIVASPVVVSGQLNTAGDTLDTNPPLHAPAPVTSPVATQPAARTFTVTSWPAPGSSLWSIAQIEYGNGALWPKIQSANTGQYPSLASNPNLVQPGWNLSIPA